MKILPFGRAGKVAGCTALVACGDLSALTEAGAENGAVSPAGSVGSERSPLGSFPGVQRTPAPGFDFRTR